MTVRICLAAAALIAVTAAVARAEIVTEVVPYTVGGTTLTGYLAYDDGVTGSRPGVLVVHEWWGHNAYARRRAELLAGLGYTAFALDMYGEGKVTDHPSQAGAFAREALADLGVAEARFAAALDLLRGHPTVDAARVAAIGYCFGGGVVLHAARTGTDLDAVVSFHGSLAPKAPAAPGAVSAEILVLTGADDPLVPLTQVDAFRAEMTTAGADVEIVSYPGVVHSFTNPDATAIGERFGMPVRYDAAADADSWQRMQALFDRLFAASE